jgi:hypothetical protein
MNAIVTVDIAGARMGGAAWFSAELHSYVERTGRRDVHVIEDGLLAQARLSPVRLLTFTRSVTSGEETLRS